MSDVSGAPASAPNGAATPNPSVPWSAVPDKSWQIENKPWFETAVADEPVKEFIRAKNYANPDVVAKSLYELNRAHEHAKSNSVALPAENATPEDIVAFHKKLGRPDNVEGYKDVKWGEGADPKMVEFGKNLAFELGLSPKLVEGVLAKKWNEFAGKMTAEGVEAARVANEATLTTLKTEWKGDFDANLAAGQRVMKALEKNGISEADLAAVEQHIGVAPLVKLLATIGKMTGEAGLPDNNNNQGGDKDVAGMSPEQAKIEIERVSADGDFQKRYQDRNDAGHKAAVDRMAALYEKAGTLISA